MRVTRLRLEGFRNIKTLDITPCDGVNVIWGDNAQGKTNLLEAIWLFCGERSFRGAKDSEFLPFGEERTSLDLTFFAEGREQTASLKLGGEQKRLLLNGIKADRMAALSGVFQAVVFSPDHLELVKQGPKNRRKLIDSSLCQAYPKYGKILESYEKILRQRAFLLKDAGEHPQIADMLDVWDGGLIEYGGYLTWMRNRYVNKLAAYAAEAYEGISSGREKFSARYAASCGEIPPDGDRVAVTKLMERAVQTARPQDIRLGQTSVGPHRDDMEILVGEKSARTYGSQGQQRSCVLALKLAECRILEEGANEPPVVLLDDVMSELDEGRRNYLLNHLTGRQVFITCCDADLLKTLDGGCLYSMKAGEIAAG